MARHALLIHALVLFGIAMTANAQQAPGLADRVINAGNTPPYGLYVPQDHRPPLFYREDFKAPPQGVHEMPVTQAFIENPNLQLKLYGPGGTQVQIDHHEGEPKDDPNFLWTGLTQGPWAVAFRHKDSNVNLMGLGRIRWRTQQTGFHAVRPIVKLASGRWLVGEYAEGWTPDWHEAEFWPAWIRWRQLDIEHVVEAPTGNAYENGRWEPNPDLSNVEEFGVTDMMAGSGHGQGGWSRIDWVEVYGTPVKREATSAGVAGK